MRNADLSVFPHIHGAVMTGWSNRDKYEDELLDTYLDVEDADALYAEYAAKWRRVHARTCKHAMALARVCSERIATALCSPSARTCNWLHPVP
ncbi:MAG TPA: hypothetical protein VEU94_02070 [Terriglobales bacterium]|nr:hypothetical protein [Terriglobales bacterium]